MSDAVGSGVVAKGVTVKEDIFAADTTLVVDDLNNVVNDWTVLLLVIADVDTMNIFSM